MRSIKITFLSRIGIKEIFAIGFVFVFSFLLSACGKQSRENLVYEIEKKKEIEETTSLLEEERELVTTHKLYQDSGAFFLSLHANQENALLFYSFEAETEKEKFIPYIAPIEVEDDTFFAYFALHDGQTEEVKTLYITVPVPSVEVETEPYRVNENKMQGFLTDFAVSPYEKEKINEETASDKEKQVSDQTAEQKLEGQETEASIEPILSQEEGEKELEKQEAEQVLEKLAQEKNAQIWEKEEEGVEGLSLPEEEKEEEEAEVSADAEGKKETTQEKEPSAEEQLQDLFDMYSGE